MSSDLDHPFVDYLHKADVATLVDELLGTLAESKPTEPLSGIYNAINKKIHAKAKRHSKGEKGLDIRRQNECFIIADRLVELYATPELLENLERCLGDDHPTSFLLSLQLAKAKLVVRNLPSHHCTVLLPVTTDSIDKFQNCNSHTYGESLLKQKWNELQWLYSGSLHSTWSMCVVGGDDTSLQSVKEAAGGCGLTISEDEGCSDNSSIYLIDSRNSDFVSDRGTTADSSQIIASGLQHVLDLRLSVSTKKHIAVISTTSSLSISLGSISLLLQPLLTDPTKQVIASMSKRNFCGKIDPATGMPIPGVSKAVSLLHNIENKYIRALYPPLGILEPDVNLSTTGFENCELAVCVPSCVGLPEKILSENHSRECLFIEILCQLALLAPGKKIIKAVDTLYIPSGIEVEKLADSDGAARFVRESFSFLEKCLVSVASLRDSIKNSNTQTTTGKEWCSYLDTVTFVQYSQFFDIILKALQCKSVIPACDPTVSRMSVEETHALSTCPESTAEILVWD